MLKAWTTVGWVASPAGPDGFSHATATAGLGWKDWSLLATWVARLDDDVLPDAPAAGGLGYDTRAYVTIGFSRRW